MPNPTQALSEEVHGARTAGPIADHLDRLKQGLLHWRMFVRGGQGGGMSSRRCHPVSMVPGSAFKGFRFPPEIIVLAVRWYLRYGLSYRDLEELLAERGVEVDHVTVFRWVQCFTPLLVDAARPCRRAVGDRWFVDETYVRSQARGGTSTGPSISTSRSLMYSSHRNVTRDLRDGSSSRCSVRTASQCRS
jgi:hypothetical protein